MNEPKNEQTNEQTNNWLDALIVAMSVIDVSLRSKGRVTAGGIRIGVGAVEKGALKGPLKNDTTTASRDCVNL